MKLYIIQIDELPFARTKEGDNLAVSRQLIGKPCVQAKKEEKKISSASQKWFKMQWRTIRVDSAKIM